MRMEISPDGRSAVGGAKLTDYGTALTKSVLKVRNVFARFAPPPQLYARTNSIFRTSPNDCFFFG
jgi:hypothetical protein